MFSSKMTSILSLDLGFILNFSFFPAAFQYGTALKSLDFGTGHDLNPSCPML